VQPIAVTIDQHERTGTVIGQPPRGRRAYARCGASDQDDAGK
jgi:hypothetical protein